MQPLLTCPQAAALDRATQEGGRLDARGLMENAAAGMFQALMARYSDCLRGRSGQPAVSLVGLCGGGNNGGDCLALLRQALFAGLSAVVALVPRQRSAVCQARLDEAIAAGLVWYQHDAPEALAALSGAGLILDGLCGTGFRPGREADAFWHHCHRFLLAHPERPVVAIDIPSGLAALPAGLVPAPGGANTENGANAENGADRPAWYRPLPAHVTLTVLPAKAELYFPGNRPLAGDIIGIPGVFPADSGRDSPIQRLQPDDLARLWRRPDPDAHKGSRGALLVTAGSVGASGAASLSSRAAAAAGAGTVTLLLRDELYPLLAGSLDNIMVRPLSSGPGRKATARLLGPGLGRDSLAADLVAAAWQEGGPLVLDADALSQIGRLPARTTASRAAPGADVAAATSQSVVQTVLTPHAGEYVRLLADCGLGPSDPAAALRQARYNPPDLLTALATRCNAIIVLKNSLTWLAHPDGRLLVYEGRVPALACGGSGDVLAGLLAGLTAAGYDAWSAAALAVLVHGETGRAMAARHGFIIPGQLLAPAARCLYHGVWHD